MDKIAAVNTIRVLWLLPVDPSRCAKAWVCGRSLTGIVGSNHAGGLIISAEDSYRMCDVSELIVTLR